VKNGDVSFSIWRILEAGSSNSVWLAVCDTIEPKSQERQREMVRWLVRNPVNIVIKLDIYNIMKYSY
jgi:hypothetical protein